jgi:large subunit ribosomal protein L20
MTRVKRGVVTRRRHKRILKQTKGFWGQRKNIVQRARETLMRAMAFAFSGRKQKKRSMRGLFIARISAGVKAYDMSYNRFIYGLKKANITLNRKMLSQLAIYDPAAFFTIVNRVQSI